ncbi:MAG: hypothetical protein JST00_30135 [Deltaproteobacteria bacterium]|nr:hypothetical protein [Deltaproteobacteria bacterium]
MHFTAPRIARIASARPRVWALVRVAGLVASALLAGCRPEIGDKCILSTDCSTRGDRLCDTSQPGGYCTQFACQKDSCPDEAHCILFNAAIPGCGFDDRAGSKYGSRVGRTFCAANCEKNEDCRSGYVCADPRLAPWNGVVIDTNQNARTCLVADVDVVDAGALTSTSPASVCTPPAKAPDPYDASAPSLPSDAGTVVPPLLPDGGAPADAGDAGDAGDGGI